MITINFDIYWAITIILLICMIFVPGIFDIFKDIKAYEALKNEKSKYPRVPDFSTSDPKEEDSQKAWIIYEIILFIPLLIWSITIPIILCAIEPTSVETTTYIDKLDKVDKKLIVYANGSEFEIDPKYGEIEKLNDALNEFDNTPDDFATVIVDDKYPDKLIYDRKVILEKQIGPFLFKREPIEMESYITVTSEEYNEIFPELKPQTVFERNWNEKIY